MHRERERRTEVPATEGALAPHALLWHVVTDSAVLVDADGRVADASPTCERVLGRPCQALLGGPVVELFEPDDRVTLAAYVERPELAREPTTLTLSVSTPEGPRRCHVTAAAHAGDPPVLALGIRPDDDADANEVLQRALDELRVVDEMKHRLLESVSHELRTPLTVISGFAQTLQRRGLRLGEDELREVAEAVERHTNRLVRLVSDLLDLDRLSRGSMLLDLAPHELSEVVTEVVGGLAVPTHPVTLDLTPVTLLVDRARFERLVEDLVVNVHRHTPPGTRLEVRLRATPSGALLEVADDGPGLTSSLGDDVFSPFVQGTTTTPASPGMGIGLALVRRFAELHGGRAWATAPPQGGTVVSVSLPSRPPDGGDADELARVLRSAVEIDRSVTSTLDAGPRLRPDAHGLVGPILRSVRRELGMQVAYLSVFTTDAQVVVALDGDGEPLGLAAGVTLPLHETYCARMVDGTVGHVVPDATAHDALADLPATRAGVRSYVGVPIWLPDGHLIGTLCCADARPNPPLPLDTTGLMRAISRVIGDQFASRDVITDDEPDVRRRVEQLLARPSDLTTLYQPIVDLGDGAVVGAEGLSRFPDSRLRPPDTWFADASRVGLGIDLDQLALARALAGLDQLGSGLYLSVNVTPASLVTGGLRPLLGLDSLDRIVLEITEHAAVGDYDRLTTALRPFRSAGMRLAIDDVGSGYATLQHVVRLRPDVIKIDRSLVSNVTREPIQHAIATGLAGVARHLGAAVVAEGIEDADTLRALVDAGVTHGQGWLFDAARPLPLPTTSYTW